jgi:hypothetical protein|tara:strand:- start:20 stop:301 length:282 start_codon:yes stop_codon:yes gene_type:complete
MTWEQIKSPKEAPTTSIDGYKRSSETEKLLNKLVASVFKGDDGKQVLGYLKSITTEAVAGPHMTTNELFHLEGRRFLVAILQNRINAHQQEKK